MMKVEQYRRANFTLLSSTSFRFLFLSFPPLSFSTNFLILFVICLLFFFFYLYHSILICLKRSRKNKSSCALYVHRLIDFLFVLYCSKINSKMILSYSNTLNNCKAISLSINVQVEPFYIKKKKKNMSVYVYVYVCIHLNIFLVFILLFFFFAINLYIFHSGISFDDLSEEEIVGLIYLFSSSFLCVFFCSLFLLNFYFSLLFS